MTATEISDYIKQRVDMRTCADRYGFEPNRAGFIRCPFHQEKTPSLKCYEGNRGFYCYGCGTHGSVIDFVQQIYGLSFWQAAVRIDTDFGLNLPLERTATLRERREAEMADRARQAERMRRDRATAEAESEYWLLFAWWRLLEMIAVQEAPKQQDDEFSDLWVISMKERTYAMESLELADMRRMRCAGC